MGKGGRVVVEGMRLIEAACTDSYSLLSEAICPFSLNLCPLMSWRKSLEEWEIYNWVRGNYSLSTHESSEF